MKTHHPIFHAWFSGSTQGPRAGAQGRTARSARPRSTGFTLIELMISMWMVVIVAGVLYASMQVAFRAKAAAEAAVEPSRSADTVMQFIGNDLQNALPPHDPSTYTSQWQYIAGSFEGTDSSDGGFDAGDLTFYSTAEMRDHQTANGEIKEIELKVDNNKNLVRLCLRNLLSELTPNPDQEVLCRNIAGFTLQYYDGSNWNTSWDSTAEDNQLPVAVQVTLVLDRSTPQQQRLLKYTRVYQLACSMAAFDTQVNGGVSQ
jgi:type II secretion system protein J